MVPDTRGSVTDQDDQLITDSPSVSSRISQIVNSMTNRLSNATGSYNSGNWNLPSWPSYSVFRWRRNRSHRSSSLFGQRPSPSDRRSGRSTSRSGRNGRRLRNLYDPHLCSSRLESFLPPHSYAYHRDVDTDSSPLSGTPEVSVENNNSTISQSIDDGQCDGTLSSPTRESNQQDPASSSSTNEANPPSYPGDSNDTIFLPRNLYNRSIFGYSMLDRGLSGRSNRQRRLLNRLVRRHRDQGYCHSSGGPLLFPDDREKNFLSALMSILVIATLATAFTQPKWFSVKGGVCGHKFIGLQLFIELNPSTGSSHYITNTIAGHGTATIVPRRSLSELITNQKDTSSHPHSKSSEPETIITSPKNIDWSMDSGRRDVTVENGSPSSEILPKPQSLFAFNYPMSADSYNQIINGTMRSINLTSLILSNESPAATIIDENNSQKSVHSSKVDEIVPKMYDEKAFKREREQLLLLRSLSPIETLNGFNHLGHSDGDNHSRNRDVLHTNTVGGASKRPSHQSSNAHHNTHHVKKTCSYNEILPLQRTIILLCLIAILANLAQFFLDTLGTNKKWLNIIRIHAVGSIFGVICSIFIIGICYIIATLIEANEKTSFNFISNHPSVDSSVPGESFANETASHIEVRFELSYYMITLAGLIGLFASACNLLKYSSIYLSSSTTHSPHLTHNRPFDTCSPTFTSCEDEPLTPLWASGATGISFALPTSILNGNATSSSSPSSPPVNVDSVDPDRISSTSILMPPSYPHPFLVQPPPPYSP